MLTRFTYILLYRSTSLPKFTLVPHFRRIVSQCFALAIIAPQGVNQSCSDDCRLELQSYCRILIDANSDSTITLPPTSGVIIMILATRHHQVDLPDCTIAAELNQAYPGFFDIKHTEDGRVNSAVFANSKNMFTFTTSCISESSYRFLLPQ